MNIDVFPLLTRSRSSLAVGSFAQFPTTSVMFQVACRGNRQSDTTRTQVSNVIMHFIFYMNYCDAAPQTERLNEEN